MSDPYTGRLTTKAHGKHGERVQWFVTITHPDWTNGIDSIGASTLLGKQDSEPWKHAKRENLKHSLLKHAADNKLPTEGLDTWLTELLKGVQP